MAGDQPQASHAGPNKQGKGCFGLAEEGGGEVRVGIAFSGAVKPAVQVPSVLIRGNAFRVDMQLIMMTL